MEFRTIIQARHEGFKFVSRDRHVRRYGVPHSIACKAEPGHRAGHAQQVAGHELPRPTKLYDRTSDQVTFVEARRIVIS